MQAAGDLVPAAAELGPGVENGHHRFQRRYACGGVLLDGDAAAVVGAGDGSVLLDGHQDLVAVASHGLVDGVVDDLVDEVVKAALVGAADVHAGTAAYGFEAFEHLDVCGGVPLSFLL